LNIVEFNVKVVLLRWLEKRQSQKRDSVNNRDLVC